MNEQYAQAGAMPQQEAAPQGQSFIQELDIRLKQMGSEKVMKLDMLLSQANPELLMLIAEAVPEAAQAMQVMMQMGQDGVQGAPAAGGMPKSGLIG
jgi:hypothetical protein